MKTFLSQLKVAKVESVFAYDSEVVVTYLFDDNPIAQTLVLRPAQHNTWDVMLDIIADGVVITSLSALSEVREYYAWLCDQAFAQKYKSDVATTKRIENMVFGEGYKA